MEDNLVLALAALVGLTILGLGVVATMSTMRVAAVGTPALDHQFGSNVY